MTSKPENELELLTYGRQCLDDGDRQAVLDVLKGQWLTQGQHVDRFEQALRDYFGVRHAVVCANGTAALHLAAMCLGWKPGDVILVPAITFLASANCAAYVGAEPYFVDIDAESFTIDVDKAEQAVLALQRRGKRVRAIVGVDLAGHPCDWPALRALADRYGLALLDDACHAMGGTYADGIKVGSCRHTEISTLSFHPVKHITTGEGGAVLTNDDDIAARARLLRSHGTVRGPENIADCEGPWHSDMLELGFNYRLTDFQCALGLSQISKLDGFVRRRREIAAAYDELLGDLRNVKRPANPEGHAHHLYIIRAPFGKTVMERREFFARCLERRMQLQVHYRPIPFNSYYRRRAEDDGSSRLPVSVSYYQEAVSLPIYPGLEQRDLERVSRAIHEFLG